MNAAPALRWRPAPAYVIDRHGDVCHRYAGRGMTACGKVVCSAVDERSGLVVLMPAQLGLARPGTASRPCWRCGEGRP